MGQCRAHGLVHGGFGHPVGPKSGKSKPDEHGVVVGCRASRVLPTPVRRKYVIGITALVFTLFHFVVVVVPVVASRASGEGQAWLVMLFDFPLVLLLSMLPGGGQILYNNTAAYTFVFCTIGTLMYAALGALVGLIIDIIRTKRKMGNL